MERELLLLGILRQREMHGYQLADFIDHNMSGWTDLKKPTTYFLLDKMAQSGWIRYEQSQEGNRPPRRVYQLTEQGEQAFQDLLRQNLSGYAPESFPNDIGIAFLDALSLEEAVGLLHKRAEELIRYREKLSGTPPHPEQAQWVLEHQLRHLDAELEWTGEIIHRLENKQRLTQEGK